MEGWNDMWFGYQCRDSFDWSEAQERRKSNHRELLQISEGRMQRQTRKCLCRWRQRLCGKARTLSTGDMFSTPLSQNCSVPCRILVGTISERIFVDCMKALRCYWYRWVRWCVIAPLIKKFVSKGDKPGKTQHKWIFCWVQVEQYQCVTMAAAFARYSCFISLPHMQILTYL